MDNSSWFVSTEAQIQAILKGRLDEALERERQKPPLPPYPFRVSVDVMKESNGVTTYVVCVDRPDRPLDAKPWDFGRMEVYHTENEEQANETAAEWRDYFAGIG